MRSLSTWMLVIAIIAAQLLAGCSLSEQEEVFPIERDEFGPVTDSPYITFLPVVLNGEGQGGGDEFSLLLDLMPIYNVTQSAIPAEASGLLGEALGIPGSILQEDGSVFFYDADRFVSIPLTLEGEGEADEDGNPTAIVALELEALEAMAVLSDAEALAQAEAALAASGLDDFAGAADVTAIPRIEHAALEMADANGEPQLSKSLDTEVIYDFTLSGVPLVGPGAKVKFAFDGSGEPALVHYAMRSLEQGEQAVVYPPEEAEARCRQAYYPSGEPLGIEGDLLVWGQMVYFAPDPQLSSVSQIFPHFQCGARLSYNDEVGTSQEDYAPIIYIPAMEVGPAVSLSMDLNGDQVAAQALVDGGTPPYRYAWSSSSTSLQYDLDTDGPEINYQILPLSPINDETLGVMVTDANGLWAYTSRRTSITLEEIAHTPGGGGKSVGIAWTAFTLPPPPLHTAYTTTPAWADAARRFTAYMQSKSIPIGFNRGELRARERDFRDPAYSIPLSSPTSPPGADHLVVDNADLVVALLNYRDATPLFTSTVDDSHLDENTIKWGNGDLEWYIADSSNSLQQYSGCSVGCYYHPWFNGLHIMFGYDSPSYASPYTLSSFAQFMLDKSERLYQSWFLAGQLTQPSFVKNWSGISFRTNITALAPYMKAPNGRIIPNLADYFYVFTPDIPPADIRGWLMVRFSP